MSRIKHKLYCGGQHFPFRHVFGSSRDAALSWFPSARTHYVHKARVAIRYACERMGIEPGDEVLAPAYNCGSEISPLLNSGASVILYRVDKKGRLDLTDLRERISQKTKAIYVTHYFGFPQPVVEIKKLCDEKHIYLIEDCALSLFSCDGKTKLGSVGDISVYNFPKILPVPDGGALVINNPDLAVSNWRRQKPPILEILRNMLPLVKQHVLYMSSCSKFLYQPVWSVLKKTRSITNHEENCNIAFPDIPSSYYYDEKLNNRRISKITERMLRTFGVTKIVNTRRANFRKYLDLLSDVKGVDVLYKELPEGVCPLYLPIIVDKRKQVCEELNALSINTIAWWSGYHSSLPWPEYPGACFLKDNLLVLPIHQQLNHNHIEFIVQKLKDVVVKLRGSKKSISLGGDNSVTPKRLDVVCFGGGDWWYHNRAHIDMQIMRRFARVGTVLYVNSIVIQKPKFGKNSKFIDKFVRKAKSIMTGLKQSGEGFWVYSPLTLPVHHIPWARQLNELLLTIQIRTVVRKLKIHNPIIWVACPGACDTSIRLPKSALIWQRTDRWEEFPNVDTRIISAYDRKLKVNADLTVFVSSLLYGAEYKQCRNALCLDHGVDYEMFAHAYDNGTIPQDMANIRKPIVGFFGQIDGHTFDVHFIEKVTECLPEISFVLIGKALNEVDCHSLLSRKNVWMLGQKPYKQVPHYGKCFDVAIMPWCQNRWIEACNPIKLKEYLALGKPVVSTPFPELQKYDDVVYQAKTPREFADCIKRALTEDNAERIASRRRKVEKSTWDSKAQLVLKELFGREGH